MKKYDYLIVGSGLFGLVWNYLAQKDGKSCLIIEKRDRIGGNIVTDDFEGIPIHKYGPHIFHTNNKEVWNFVNENCEVYNFINQPIANYNGTLFNLPFNMNTFYKIFGVTSPQAVQAKIDNEIKKMNIQNPKNLEEQAISMVGTSIYNTLIKEYTEKQWGRKCTELPADIIKRLPLRFTFDNNYFNAKYQGMPNYNELVDTLSKGAEILTNTDYFEKRDFWNEQAEKVIYTGAIDEFFDFNLGKLDWRTVYWKNEERNTGNYQGVACMNYTSNNIPYTRIIEHRHFYTELKNMPENKTLLSYEYSEEYSDGKEKFYPVNDEKNNELYQKYKAQAESMIDKFIFGGRLGEYKYYDMDGIIARCFEVYKNNE